MKTTFDLPDDLIISAKKRAAELRVPLRVLVAQGLQHELERLSEPQKAKRLKLHTVAGKPNWDVTSRDQMLRHLERGNR